MNSYVGLKEQGQDDYFGQQSILLTFYQPSYIRATANCQKTYLAHAGAHEGKEHWSLNRCNRTAFVQ